MQIATTIEAVKQCVAEARIAGKKVGLVPTMGALHVGHVSLMEAAAARCEFVVVSLFVNPMQFGPGEDFDNYPKPFEKDIEICEEHGVAAVFTPGPDEMYPSENLTWVNVEKLTEPLCGRDRPIHFRGVTTVCTKLFNIVGPDVAFFGQKDGQQAIVIKRMVADLNMPLEIVVCPTVREPDGLAVSSRNRYLNPQQRQDATAIYRSLEKCRELVEGGATDAYEIRRQMEAILKQVPALEIEYVSVVDANSLQEIEWVQSQTLVAVAACLGPARLIDNILVDTASQ